MDQVSKKSFITSQINKLKFPGSSIINKRARLTLHVIILTLIFGSWSGAQKIYFTGAAEVIFSSSNVEFSTPYLAANPDAELSTSKLRHTCFYIAERQMNKDFGKYFGLYAGLSIKNVGLITDEILALPENGLVPEYYKISRRLYTLGIPVAIKLGALEKSNFIYFGGEYEFVLNYKEKYWTGAHDRRGSKTKYNEWFPEQAESFLPSVFVGYQFSQFMGLRFRYYFNDFLNNEYTHSNPVSDLSRYSKTQVFYISLVLHAKTEKKNKKKWTNEDIEI